MQKNGFTLLELSVVLTILALLVGSITIGTSLIRTSKVQSIYSDSQHYISVVKAFQDKYSAMPGDFSNAGNLFSGVTSGNGNGLIAGAEQFYAWTHLTAAKMVDGTFTGADVAGGGTYDRVPGTNIPAAQITGAGWGLVYVDSGSSDLLYVTNDILPGHVLWFGGRSTTGLSDRQTPVLTSEESDQIDRKVDDGLPGTGKVVAQVNDNAPFCHSSTSAYALSNEGLVCSLVFKTGY